MSAPTAADFALIEMLSGGAYKSLSGIEGVQISRSTQLSERFVRDCDRPNRAANRRLRPAGQAFSVTGSGFDDVESDGELSDAFARSRSYAISLYRDDDSDLGALLGRYIYGGVATARNQNFADDADGAVEIVIEGEGKLTWLPLGGTASTLVANETTIVLSEAA